MGTEVRSDWKTGGIISDAVFMVVESGSEPIVGLTDINGLRAFGAIQNIHILGVLQPALTG